MKRLILLCVFLRLMSMVYGHLGGVNNNVTCSEALRTLLPCLPFLAVTVESLSGPCCIAVSTSKGKADTMEACRSVCQCLKETTPKVGMFPEKAKLVPELYKVDLPAHVNPNVDCSKVL